MTRRRKKIRNRIAILSILFGIVCFVFLLVYMLVCSQLAKSSGGVGPLYPYDAASAHGESKLIEVPYLSQAGDYPTGCESVSAVMVLQYYGVSLTPSEFIDRYLPTEEFTWRGETRVGADPKEAFVGDPYSSSGYGCYAPVIVKALRAACPQGLEVRNETGSSLSQLADKYIDAEIPVVIWATMNMKEPSWSSTWELSDGSTFTWPSGEHCLVLVGYDNDRYYFNDPYQNNGVVGFERGLVETRYEQLGYQAVAVVRVS